MCKNVFGRNIYISFYFKKLFLEKRYSIICGALISQILFKVLIYSILY